MASVNKAILIGNLGADPDVRKTRDGRPVASFRVATGRQWRDKDTGERKEITHWHSVVVFNEALAKVAEQYLKKGSKVYVEGEMQTRKWTDQGGVDRYVTEVVLQAFGSTLTLLDKREGVPPASDSAEYGTQRSAPDGADAGRGIAPRNSGGITSGKQDSMDDEIPF